MPEISIIVPVYKAEPYIHRCIDSILAQTFTDFELILVDDGSPDNCGRICDEYAISDERITVIHQANQGQAVARNNAVVQAKGEWVCFVDSDDLIHPQYIEFLFNAALATQAKISICRAHEGESCPEGFYHVQDIHIEKFTIDEQRLFDWFHHHAEVGKYAYWTVWCKLIHKSIIEQYPFTPGRFFEDNAVVCKWLHAAEKVTYCDNVLYYYYVNSAGTTKSSYSLKRLDWLWAVREQMEFYKKVRYLKMETMLRKRYIWEALRVYEDICLLLNDKKNEGKMRNHITYYCVQNYYRISLTYSEKMEILSRLYPKTMLSLSKIKRKLFK